MATENERQFVAGQIMLHVDMSNGNVAEWKSNEKMIGGFKWFIFIYLHFEIKKDE